MKNSILKLRHNTLFGIILGIILCSGIVYGAKVYESNAIEYSPIDSSWEVSNVNEAINGLYSMKEELDDIKSVGDATASDIADGKTAVVQGVEVTGTKVDSKAVYCGSYTANGSFNITTYGLSNVDVNNFVFVPDSSTYYENSSIVKGVETGPYFRIYYGYFGPSFTLSGNTLSFTLPAISNSMYGGTSNSISMVHNSLGSVTFKVKGAIYYITK